MFTKRIGFEGPFGRGTNEKESKKSKDYIVINGSKFRLFFKVQTPFLESAAKTIRARDFIFGKVLYLVL